MKQTLAALLLFIALGVTAADDYRYKVNLNKVVNDKVTVVLSPPDIAQQEIDFLFPAMVPGTYEVYNFGRFISNFKALGQNGEVLKVNRVNVNTFRISDANKLKSISYDVDDTFDKCDLPGTKEKIVFEPGGTNFEDGKNFSINNHTLFGYFKGMTRRKFILEFEKPKGFYPSTGLSTLQVGAEKDVITAADYHELADSPLMYFLPDTATVQVANTKVLVSCYSPKKMITAKFIAGTLSALLDAQRSYLGGELPVSKYAFLFYFASQPTQSGASGALEHSYSSFYVLPEYDSTLIQQQIRDVAAHEFFHIVTPLTIHAKEIGDFDFNDPKMSEHLWLYEGMTEYAAHHAQLKGGIISIEDFMNTMMQKYEGSLRQFNDTMSFTWMSKHVLEEKVHAQYGNVYEKGALIGMCLDILLRDLSQGSYGTQNLMKDLAKQYGKDKSFNDADLFADIEKLTYPEVGAFLRTHVGGGKPLPMQEIFAKIGINFAKEAESYEFSLGNPELGLNTKTSRIYVEGTSNLDEFGKALKLKRGDELYKLNGNELKLDRLKDVVSGFYASVKEGDEVVLEVYRPRLLKNRYRRVELKAKAKKVKVVRSNRISLMENLSGKQRQTLKSWAGLKA